MKNTSLYQQSNHSSLPGKISGIHHQQNKGILFSQGNIYNSNVLEYARQSQHRSPDKEVLPLSVLQDKKMKPLKDPNNNNKLTTIFQMSREKRFVSLPQPSKLFIAEGKMLHSFSNQSKYPLKSPSSTLALKNLPLDGLPQTQNIQGNGMSMMQPIDKISSSKMSFFPQTKTPANKPQIFDNHTSQSTSFEKRTRYMNLTRSTMINHKTESSPFEDKLFSPPSTSTNFQSFDSHEEARKLIPKMPSRRAFPSWNITDSNSSNSFNPKLKQENTNEIFPRSPQVLPEKYFSTNDKLSKLPVCFSGQSIERVTAQKQKQQFSSTQDIRNYGVTKETQSSETISSSNKIISYSNREVLEDLRDIQSRFYELKGYLIQSITSNGNWFVQKLEDIANGSQQINMKAFANFIVEIAKQALFTCTKSLVKLERQTSNSNNINNPFALSFKLNEVIKNRLTKIFIDSLRSIGCTVSSSASYNLILNYFENECKKQCVNNISVIQISQKLQQQILDNSLANLLKENIGIEGNHLKKYYSQILDFWDGLLSNNEEKLLEIIRSNNNLIKQNLTSTMFFFMKYSLMLVLSTERQLNKSTRGRIIKQFEKIRANIFPDQLFATNLIIAQFKQEFLKHPKIQQTFEDPHKNSSTFEEQSSFNANRQGGSLNNSAIEGILETNSRNQNQKNLNSSSLSFHQQNMSLSKMIISNRTNNSYLQSISSQMVQALSGRKRISLLISYLERYSNPENSENALKDIAEIMKDSMIQSLIRTQDSSIVLQEKDLEFKMIFFQHINDLEILEDSFSDVFQFMQHFKKWIADKMSLDIIPSQDSNKDHSLFSEDSQYYRFLEYLIFSLASKDEIYSVYDIDAAKRIFQIEPQPFKILLNELAFFLSQNNFPKQPIKLLIVYIQKMSLVL